MNDNVPGTMKPTTKNKSALERPCPVKYRLTFEDYELQQRRLAKEGKNFIDKEHELWFGDGKKKKTELAGLQKAHRKAGLSDDNFLHPLDPRRKAA